MVVVVIDPFFRYKNWEGEKKDKTAEKSDFVSFSVEAFMFPGIFLQGFKVIWCRNLFVSKKGFDRF